MKIRMLRNGVRDGETNKPLKKDDVIEVSKKRGEAAIKSGYAEEVYEKKVIEPETETKEVTPKKKRTKKAK